MKSYQADFKVTDLCRALGVSTSGYYAWLTRPPSERRKADLLLGDRLEALHRKSRSTYGRPRLRADLHDEGFRISDKRLARIMRERRIVGATRRKGFKTTIRDGDARPAPDLVDSQLYGKWL